MNKINRKEIKKLSRYREITLIVADAIIHKQTNRDLSIVKNNKYASDFWEKIASEEMFEKQDKILKSAFEKREVTTLIDKLKEDKRRTELKRRSFIAIISSAAAILIAVFIYFLSFNDTHKMKYENNDIFTPTLISNDSNISLDTAKNTLKMNDISNPNQQLVSTNNTVISQIHKLVVPKGYTYNIELKDGTIVHLNARSELHFSDNYGENERIVTLIGEGYFEVKKSNVPFIVKIGNMYIKVYGTSFNINAREIKNVKTILVEGSVGVGIIGEEEIKIAPNEMILFNSTNGNYKTQTVDPKEYLGWKDGYFRYINRPVTAMLQEMSLWYGVNFKYDENLTTKNINISFERNMKLKDALEFIESIMNIRFVKENEEDYQIIKK